MAKWSKNKVDSSTINGGNEFTTQDNLAINELNAVVNNSFYASNIAENVANQLSNFAPNEKIEFKGSNPNLLINGDFRVNQRGQTSYSGNNIYGIDRWIIRDSVVDVVDNGIKVTQSGQWFGINQSLENFNHLKGKTVTLSIKFSNVDMTGDSVYIALSNSNTAQHRGTVLEILDNIKQAGVYTITTTIPSTLELKCFNICIQNYKGVSTTTNNFTVEYAKLEIGSVATAFSPRTYAEELAMCQRYYIKIKPQSTYQAFATGVCYSSTSMMLFIPTPTTIRTAGTLSLSGVFRFYSSNNFTNTATNMTFSPLGKTENGFYFSATTSTEILTAGNSVLARFDTAESFVSFDAEIY